MNRGVSRQQFVWARVWISVRRRLVLMVLAAVLAWGLVAHRNPVAAVGLGLLTFALALLLVTLEAVSRHQARWEWWLAGAGLPGNSEDR